MGTTMQPHSKQEANPAPCTLKLCWRWVGTPCSKRKDPLLQAAQPRDLPLWVDVGHTECHPYSLMSLGDHLGFPRLALHWPPCKPLGRVEGAFSVLQIHLSVLKHYRLFFLSCFEISIKIWILCPELELLFGSLLEPSIPQHSRQTPQSHHC